MLSFCRPLVQGPGGNASTKSAIGGEQCLRGRENPAIRERGMQAELECDTGLPSGLYVSDQRQGAGQWQANR